MKTNNETTNFSGLLEVSLPGIQPHVKAMSHRTYTRGSTGKKCRGTAKVHQQADDKVIDAICECKDDT